MKTDWIPKLGLLAALIGGAPVAAETICAATADLAADGCKNAVQEDYLIASGKCLNVSATAARNRCLDAAVGARRMDLRLCRKQQLARFSICNALREDRYDPNVSPALFDDDLAHLTRPNRYFPLAAGDRWEWAGAESVVVEVLDRAKLIAGVRCFVVRDTVSADGTVVEDTEDWFAQARNGDTYYFGEESKDYEIFEGDEPPTPELITLEGSFKAGRGGDKPGIAFLAAPRKGKVYRQEFSLGNAEDIAEVVSTTYGYGRDAELDRLVPRQLAELLCAGDCVVTKEYQPLAPGVFERKFYAPGIGGFLVIHLDSAEVVQLVGCNFDPRCAALPAP
ncbi:MAG TPA: hypothetical protein VN783_16440 [Thermoanaerobaculia bacterium]|nr:hypothetical protein [Thermoanaerobaculia bacterium]